MKRAFLIAAPAALAWLRPTLVQVEGESMLPVLRPDDRLLVSRRLSPALDDVVVAQIRDVAMVKRVSAITGSDAVLEGDNQSVVSTNAVVGRDQIEGVVVARLWPNPFVGRVRRP